MSLNKLAFHLHIPHATLYHKQKQQEKDEMMKDQILEVLSLHPAYGHRRIALALGLGKRMVRRVMRLYGIKPYKRMGRWRKRRDERRIPAPFENLIKRICPIQPSIIWVSDFTYLRYQDRFLYVATFMDRYTREIVGWDISARHTKELIINAFWDGVKTTKEFPQIVHSDQGVEYTNETYTTLMQKLGIQISMSRKASPWENGYQESFYNNFKTDLGLEFDRFLGVGELVEAVHYTIIYYNQKRIHTNLKMSPTRYRLAYEQKVLEKVVEKMST